MKQPPVSPGFTTFVTNYCATHNVQVLVPEVVFGELLFQHTSSAVEILEKINKQFSALSGIAAKKYAHNVSEDRVKKDVHRKLGSWALSCGAEIVETPVIKIDWRRLISDALWRLPPFTEDKKTEKGFRDSLIMETVLSVAAAKPNTQIDFVSSDGLLRQAVRSRAGGLQISVFESIEDYSSHLRLLEQELTEKFVSEISDRASRKFLSHIWQAGKIREEIKKRFSDLLLPPSPPAPAVPTAPTSGILRLLSTKRPDWQQETPESFWVFRPQFERREDGKIYKWKSQVHVVQLFRNSGGAAGTILTDRIEENELRVRNVIIDVDWDSTVAADGRFTKCRLNQMNFVRTEFRRPTGDEIALYAPQLIGEHALA